MIYPWHNKAWEQFVATKQQQQLPHALLVVGSEGIGRECFAHEMAKSLLCESPDEQGFACGQCKSCKVYGARAHPDYTEIGLPEGKQQIPIEAIRELGVFMELSRSYQGYRVALILSADHMNRNSSNSLLKVLEEPPDNTVIILVASQRSQILPTIHSRCQALHLHTPDREQSLHWLRQQHPEFSHEILLSIAANRPLLAAALGADEQLQTSYQALAQDLIKVIMHEKSVIEIAKKWEKTDKHLLLDWQLEWVQTLIKYHVKSDKYSGHNDFLAELHNQIDSLERYWRIHDSLLKLKTMTDYPLNPLLFTENMILSWMDTPNP